MKQKTESELARLTVSLGFVLGVAGVLAWLFGQVPGTIAIAGLVGGACFIRGGHMTLYRNGGGK
jgi:hypothetical protein